LNEVEEALLDDLYFIMGPLSHENIKWESALNMIIHNSHIYHELVLDQFDEGCERDYFSGWISSTCDHCFNLKDTLKENTLEACDEYKYMLKTSIFECISLANKYKNYEYQC